MRLLSTRDHTVTASSAQTFLQGIAPDGGLYVPGDYPVFSLEEISKMAELSYRERAQQVLESYLTDYTQEELCQCIDSAYRSPFQDRPAPLYSLDDCRMLELWHGPTSAFKDIALQLLPSLLAKARLKQNIAEDILILVATSGDTGKAALTGFVNVPGIQVVVFYPNGGVSEIQRLQMVTQEGENVYSVAVRGNFDDAQTAVKRLFGDSGFVARQMAGGRILSSANSINFGRLVPQVVYYFSAYADMLAAGDIRIGDKINFVVPTGNFGNILAAWYALNMGLPVHRIICASNQNNVLTDFIATGCYNIKREFYKTSSPSMDILISSNLERLLFDLCDRDSKLIKRWMSSLNKSGGYDIGTERCLALRKIFVGGWVDDSCVSTTIAKLWNEKGYLVDTHTAVAYTVFDEYRARTGDITPTVIVSTASPYKFPRDVLAAIGGELPESEFACADQLENFTQITMPDPLRSMRGKSVLHGTVCDIAEIRDVVETLVNG